MKQLFHLSAFVLFALVSCKKTSVTQHLGGGWQLAQKQSCFGPTCLVSSPTADSSVTLVLDANNNYRSELNGNLIAQGSYSISTNVAYNNTQVLQLNNFVTTGIFNLFTIEQIDTNGHVLSTFNGLYMKTSNDTLTLSSPLTPGGFISYTFVKN